jgi:hypothetical protein
MRWFKVAAAGVGILIALIIGWAVVGFVLHAVEFIVIAALVVGAVAVAIKVARSGKQISRKRADREVREREPEPEYSRSLPRADVEPAATSYSAPPSRPNTQDIDDELARMKREMGA